MAWRDNGNSRRRSCSRVRRWRRCGEELPEELGLMGKKNTILQSAKLLVAVREIFLNDEQDFAYSNSVYEQYVNNIRNIEKKPCRI